MSNKLADRIAAVRNNAQAAEPVASPVKEETTQASTLAERMRDDQIDRTSLVLFVNQIQVGAQARKKFRNLEELAANIKERGLLQPIVVRELSPHRYLLLSGERRLRAVRDHLKQDMISARLITTAADEQTWRLSQLSENLQREEYEPLELAREFAALKEHFGYTDASLAEALQVSRTWVWKQVSLLAAPAEIQQAIDDGRIAATDYLNNKSLYSNEGGSNTNQQPPADPAASAGAQQPTSQPSASAPVQRIPTVTLPAPSTLEVAKLLQVLAEKRGLSPIILGDNPSKKELTAIVTTRVSEILSAIKTDAV